MRDPREAWIQRATEPPVLEPVTAGRPVLAEADIRERYAEAKAALIAEGSRVTIAALAERLDRSDRTIREWRDRFDLR